jgi:hypothetical protein
VRTILTSPGMASMPVAAEVPGCPALDAIRAIWSTRHDRRRARMSSSTRRGGGISVRAATHCPRAEGELWRDTQTPMDRRGRPTASRQGARREERSCDLSFSGKHGQKTKPTINSEGADRTAPAPRTLRPSRIVPAELERHLVETGPPINRSASCLPPSVELG